MKRFVLLEYVEQIIKEPQAVLDFREIEIKHKGVKRIAKSWTFVKIIQSCKIKVIVGHLDGEDKRFISIFGNNVKYITPTKKPQ